LEKVHGNLKEKGWNLQQEQAFIPTPMTLATAMYWTGIDPMSKKALFVPKTWEDRKLQQALLQPHKKGHAEILRKYRRGRPAPPGGAGGPQSSKRSLVQPPKGKLGPKLLLDSR
ncbi:MAG: DUF3362 domain-containing protein, partial [Bacteriovoracia bacterium]